MAPPGGRGGSSPRAPPQAPLPLPGAVPPASPPTPAGRRVASAALPGRKGRGALHFPVFEVGTVAAALLRVGRQPLPTPPLPSSPCSGLRVTVAAPHPTCQPFAQPYPSPREQNFPLSLPSAWNAVHPAEPAPASGLTGRVRQHTQAHFTEC